MRNAIQGKMILLHVGIIADLLWCEIKNHAKNIKLGEFVVMPNHVRGIDDGHNGRDKAYLVSITNINRLIAIPLATPISRPYYSRQIILFENYRI